MARGYDTHQAHQQALNELGRALARRARSRCELCEASGVSLSPWEVPPAPEEPDLDTTLLLCERCRGCAEGDDLAETDWHLLEGTAWSESPAVQVTSIRLLRTLAENDVGWAQITLESVFLSPEVEAWLDA